MKNKGYILVVTLITITAIFFFAIIFTRFFVNERQLSQEKEHSMVAAAAAEAGIDEAIYQIKLDKTWTSGFSKSLPNSKAQYSITFATGQEPYSTNNSGNSSSVIGYEGRVVPAYSIHLVCKGKYGNQSNIQQAIVSAGSESPYKNTALFASRYIGLQTYYTNNSEILIDSFNSALGPYGNSRENSGGNITTNQSVFGSLKGIYMLVIYYGSISRGEINVQGTVNYGPGGVESDIIRKVGYTANISYSNANEMSEIIQAPSPSSETPGNTDIYVGSGTLNLPPREISQYCSLQ